jgi:hypothetical protein
MKARAFPLGCKGSFDERENKARQDFSQFIESFLLNDAAVRLSAYICDPQAFRNRCSRCGYHAYLPGYSAGTTRRCSFLSFRSFEINSRYPASLLVSVAPLIIKRPVFPKKAAANRK